MYASADFTFLSAIAYHLATYASAYMIVRTPGELGLLIRARRRVLGMRQHQLATLIGASRLWVVEFEGGKPRAEIGLVLRALTALGLLLDVSHEPEAQKPSRLVAPDIDAIVAGARKRR